MPLTLLSFFTSKAGVLTLIGALVFGVIATQSLRLNHAKADLAALKASEKVAADEAKAREAKAQAISTQAQAGIQAARVQVRTITRTLIEKVPEYVPADADRDCVVPVGFVRIHDAAASGVSTPAGGPDQAASGVALSAVTATVAENYGIAHDWRVEALGWRDWYKAQAAVWNGKP